MSIYLVETYQVIVWCVIVILYHLVTVINKAQYLVSAWLPHQLHHVHICFNSIPVA